MLKYLFLLFFLTGIMGSVMATDGCVKTSDQTKIYTSLNTGNGKYNGSPTTPLSGGCSWNFTGGSCTVSPNSAGLLANVIQLCPLDDELYMGLFTLLIFGVYVYQNKRPQLTN
jgi:hypothetical protein